MGKRGSRHRATRTKDTTKIAPAAVLDVVGQMAKVDFKRAITEAFAAFMGLYASKTAGGRPLGSQRTTWWSCAGSWHGNGDRERARRLGQIARGMHREMLL